MDHNDKLDHKTLLQSITLPSVTNDQKVVCDNDLKDYLMLGKEYQAIILPAMAS